MKKNDINTPPTGQLARFFCGENNKKIPAQLLLRRVKKWSQLWESNPRPADYKSTALAN